jgi:hypothetical protein
VEEKRMASKRLSKETTIDFMETCTLVTLQLSCRVCKAIFYYVNDRDDTLKPTFCPECGRKAAGK